MKRMTSLLAALLIGVIAGAFLFFGAVNLNIVQSQPEVTGKVVLRELESASSLITTRYNYSKVGKYENSLEINGWSIPSPTNSSSSPTMDRHSWAAIWTPPRWM